MTMLNRHALVLASLLAVFVGCDTVAMKDAQPPTLIPAQAFTVQTELFDQSRSGGDGIGTDAMIARLRVWPVTTALAGHLTLPAAVTKAALDEKPTIEGGTWVWRATTTVGGQKVPFTLSGMRRDDYVDWTMQVTRSTAADQDSMFTLYAAQTAPDGTSGDWQLFAPAEDTTRHILSASFKMGEEKKKEITFRMPEAMREHAGDSVIYVHDEDQRNLHWVQAGTGREHVITWDAETHAGSMVATNYNDGKRACWDGELQNVACSQ